MRQTIDVALWFVQNENAIEPNKFSAQEITQLYVTAALHDQAEAIMGDIPRGRKSRRQRKLEQEVLRGYESEFVPHMQSSEKYFYRVGRDDIAFGNTQQKLPGAFRVVELIGFMQNAAAAVRRHEQLSSASLSYPKRVFMGVQDKQMHTAVKTSLERLAAEVFGSGVIGELIRAGERFPSAHVSLHRHAHIISLGMTRVQLQTFDWYETEDPGATKGEKSKRLHDFSEQKRIWDQWRSANS
ncbi:hypothetical protein IPL68_05585 [Candidatus Saccharibacteria bacterium]|nr:MAG: hypothetical protein IPL68_05585 [Candidatus Saccharibacteria bacterium]